MSGRIGPERAAASAPVRTAKTPGSASASRVSIGDDARVGVRAAQHGRVEHARAAEIVHEAAAAGHQARVLLERHRPPDPARARRRLVAHARAPAARAATACSTARTMLT